MPSLHSAFALFVPAFFLPRIEPIWLKAVLLLFPVVMLTSLGDAGLAAEARRAGVAACLDKPVRQSELYDALARAVAGGGSGIHRAVPHPTVSNRRLAGRVLVAEDNPVNQQVAVAQLARLGLHVELAGDGNAALAALERANYDLVLMDCQMPELDGYAATRELRRREAQRGGRRLPVVAMTANAVIGDREMCLAAGMDDYLSKPVRAEALGEVLSRWLKPAAASSAPAAALPAPLLPASAQVAREALATPAIAELRRDLGDSLVEELFVEYAALAPRTVDNLEQAAAAGDVARAGRAAHLLRGSSLTLGFTAVHQACEAVESAARAADLSAVQAGAPTVRAALAPVLAAIADARPA